MEIDEVIVKDIYNLAREIKNPKVELGGSFEEMKDTVIQEEDTDEEFKIE